MKKNENADTTGEILCMDRTLLGAFYTDQNTVDQDAAVGIFPKGGPKQSSWLDIRADLTKVSNIIEIGILDIPNELVTSGST